MAEDPFIGLFECRPPCLVDVCLDVARIRHCEVFEAAIPALSVLVLRVFISDRVPPGGKLDVQTYPRYFE
jgi:hypothetical protein